jgi:hypothetical protein
VDGVVVRTFTTDAPYPAGATITPPAGAFAEFVPVDVPRTGRTVCLTAINAGAGADRELGCRNAAPDASVAQAQCARTWNFAPPGSERPSWDAEAPFGASFPFDPNSVGFARCVAAYLGDAVYAVFPGREKTVAAFRVELIVPEAPLPAGTTRVEFGNGMPEGAWMVAHRAGREVAAAWRGPYEMHPPVAWNLARDDVHPGFVPADTIGFVRLQPWAVGVASFGSSAFWALEDGFIVRIDWVPFPT